MLKVGSCDWGHTQLWSIWRTGVSCYICTKFEVDSCIRSQVIVVTKNWNWVTWPRPRPRMGSFYTWYAGRVCLPSVYQIWSG